MTVLTLDDATHQLPELFAAAVSGDGVVISGRNGWSVRLIAIPPEESVRNVPKAGSCAGLIHMSDDFDAPLEDLREYME